MMVCYIAENIASRDVTCTLHLYAHSPQGVFAQLCVAQTHDHQMVYDGGQCALQLKPLQLSIIFTSSVGLLYHFAKASAIVTPSIVI